MELRGAQEDTLVRKFVESDQVVEAGQLKHPPPLQLPRPIKRFPSTTLEPITIVLTSKSSLWCYKCVPLDFESKPPIGAHCPIDQIQTLQHIERI